MQHRVTLAFHFSVNIDREGFLSRHVGPRNVAFPREPYARTEPSPVTFPSHRTRCAIARMIELLKSAAKGQKIGWYTMHRSFSRD